MAATKKRRPSTCELNSTPSGRMVRMAAIGGLVFSAILSMAVLFWPGWHTVRSAVGSLRARAATMDVLIVLGTAAALASGVAVLLGLRVENLGRVAGMLMAIFLTGRYIEASAKGRASQAIRKLVQLQVTPNG